MNQLEQRRQEQRLLAEEFSEGEGSFARALADVFQADIELSMRQRSYGEIDLSPLLRKAG